MKERGKYTADDLAKKLAAFPRVGLACLPTPLTEARDLGRGIGGPKLFIKRDDLTGLALGGNKSRKLEFIIAQALARGADTIITWGGPQSNWCFQTVAAALLHGLQPVLALFKPAGGPDPVPQGNLLLDRLAGAEIALLECGEGGKSADMESAFAAIEKLAAKAFASGRKPYTVAVGGSFPGGSMDKPYGALGYAAAMLELRGQLASAGIERFSIVHASGSGATQAGLVTAARACGLDCRVVGISVGDGREEFSRQVLFIARELVRMLDLDISIGPDDIIVDDGYFGGGYAVVGDREIGIVRDVLSREGFLLDPVYTAKAMAGLLDLGKKGYFRDDQAVVFLHSGGVPAVFAYGNEIPSEKAR